MAPRDGDQRGDNPTDNAVSNIAAHDINTHLDPSEAGFSGPLSSMSETSDVDDVPTNSQPFSSSQTTSKLPMGYKKIAIVGIGCRMPGDVNSTSDFWDVISTGKDTITDIPADRWSTEAYYNADQSKPGTHVTKRCGFIKDIDKFDHTFFKISPREAAMMDPQQRHSLEVTQEAFDDAGIKPEDVGETCGVFVGIGMMDYPMGVVFDKTLMNSYTHTGVAHSVAANRLSYAFDLRGPSFAVDTACAASMTALHLACTSLWNNECETAVVAGSNVLLLPEITVGFSALGVLSPEGKSCPFDANAKGYVRSEGFGAMILKPLETAIADGDHIYCTILGTAIADNGHNQSITMPSTIGQQKVIKTTYERFGVPMGDVSYVEAHGTGTPVGDPIEAEAIGEAFKPHRNHTTEALPIGSCKSNFGHMECSSGAVSTIKVALMAHERKLCPSINYTKPNPAIDLENLGIEIQQTVKELPSNKKHIFGVNSFGFGGALAHAIIEEYIPEDIPRFKGSAGWTFGDSDKEGKQLMIPITAKSEPALKDAAKAWMNFTSDVDAQGIVAWLAIKRKHYESRLVVIANSGVDFKEKLQRFIDDRPIQTYAGSLSTQSEEQRKICFVYPGQGQQWGKMGSTLYRSQKVYHDAINRSDTIFKKLSGWSLLERYGVFTDQPKQGRHLHEIINETEVSPPAIVFHQIALTKLWASWGITPAAVVGHSLGEVAAAFACGGITWDEAIAVALYRSQEQAKMFGNGGMAAIRMSADEAVELCKNYDDLHLACVNSPVSVTVAGKLETVEALAKANPSTVKQLRVNSAYHTAYMDPIQEGFMKKLSKCIKNKVRPRIPMYSTVTGEVKTGHFDTQYWWETIRKPVLFEPAVRKILETGADVFIECGASATLLRSVNHTAKDLSLPSPLGITSGQREKVDSITILSAAAQLYIAGVSIDWSNISENCPVWAPLPRYPWQHQSHWSEAEFVRQRRLGLVETTFKSTDGKISMKDFPFLEDHKVLGKVTFPGAGYIESIIQRCTEDTQPPPTMKDIKFKNVLLLSEEEKEKSVQLELVKKGKKVSLITGSTTHMEAMLDTTKKPTQAISFVEEVTPGSTSLCLTKEKIYKYFKNIGLDYGQEFQVLQEVLINDGTSKGRLVGKRNHKERICSNILDSCFQLAILTCQSTSAYIPIEIESLTLAVDHIPTEEPLSAVVKITDVNPSIMRADIQLFSDENELLVDIKGFVAQNMDTNTQNVDVDSCLYETMWQPFEACLPPVSSCAEIFEEHTLKTMYPDEMSEIEAVSPFVPKLQAACAAYARVALEKVPESKYHSRNGRFIERLKHIVAHDTVKLPEEEIKTLLLDVENKVPQFNTEINMIRKMGEALPEALVEPSKCVQILFGKDCLPLYFIDSLSTRIYYKAGAEILHRGVLSSLKSKQVVRVLEVGGRMGGMAQYMLKPLKELIDQGKVEYVFTDLYSTFFPHAQQTLEGYDNIKYRELDIEKNVASQGFVPSTFDIIVSMDTLHSAVDLNNGLKNMRDLLAPEGWLLLYEGSNIENIAEIIFGSLELCWVFDDFRQGRCWLDQKGWVNLMSTGGFDNVTGFSTPSEFFHSIIVGSKSSKFDHQNESMTVIYDPNLRSKPVTSLRRTITEYPQLEEVIQDSKAPVNVIFTWPSTESLSDYLLFVNNIREAARINSLCVVIQDDVTKPYNDIATGFNRVATNEISEFPVYSFKTDITKASMDHVIQKIEAGNILPREAVLNEDSLMVPRMVRTHLPSGTSTKENPNWCLDFEGSHSIDNITFREMVSNKLEHGQIRVKVVASGVNFKDVMMATGNLKDLNIATQFGLECAGIVTEVFNEETGFRVGDRVTAFADQCFASEVICNSLLAARVPDNVSLEEASGMGIIFTTVYHALVERANLQANETVLIHSACGGVGQAAIQIAKMIGANIICSAGTEEKRSFLKEHHGIQYVTDSRSLGFGDDVMTWTSGMGVDVILNSLSGHFITRGMEVLTHGGRFCEIGKRDILDNSALDMQPFLENISLLSVQIDVLMKKRPDKINRLLSKVMCLLGDGTLKPITITKRDISLYKETLRWMMTGQHVGKVVFSIDDDFVPNVIMPSKQIFSEDGCYLITGGMGGAGLALARWMSERGAQHIGLVSRSGCKTFRQKCAIQSIQRSGCIVYQLQANVSDLEKISEATTSLCQNSGRPLKGVFHLAAVIDDASINKLTEEQLTRTLNAKAKGADNLHKITIDMNLDHFVMFSSITTMYGNLEQSAYCAANAFLDALATTRHEQGLPALSIQFGAIRGAGFLERNRTALHITDSKGLKTLHINECLEFLGKALQTPLVSPVVAFANMKWDDTLKVCHSQHMVFRHLITQSLSGKVKCESSREELQQKVVTKLAEILCTPAEQIDINRAMTDYGIDSLMAVEMVQWINKEIGLNLSQLDVLGGISTALLLDKAMEGKVGLSG